MSKSEIFREFIDNLKIDNSEQISLRYGEITASLNKKFRSSESKTKNSLQVGSYGRLTAIRGISDLDMLYIMPKGKWDEYKDGGQYKLLKDTKDAIIARYPKTRIKVDRLVVCVFYKNFYIEVQPVFEQDDSSFKYPDTYKEGSWKITKPRKEIDAISEVDIEKNKNLRRLCKMARAWKNKNGIGMGGLLIDTLAHNFLINTTEYDSKSFFHYDYMCRDFFSYLKEEPNHEFYAALGSRQRVRVKKKFQKKAKKAHKLCLEAIESNGKNSTYRKWKKLFGRPFPTKPITSLSEDSVKTWDNTEQFIEDLFPVDIRYNIKIDCDITQDGFRKQSLSTFLKRKFRLKPSKKLRFHITEYDIKEEFEIYWKVLNRGDVAKERNEIRGEIVADLGKMEKNEDTCFRGEHLVECYAIKNGVVVAKDRIDVPID